MTDPSFAIDTLNLHLPPGFADRADRIARQIGNELARFSIDHNVDIPCSNCLRRTWREATT